MELVSFSLSDIDNAVVAVEALSKPEIGKETLIPIGANSFVYGTIPETNRVIIGLGANISAEVDVADAVSYLTERKKKLTEMQGQFAARLNQIAETNRVIIGLGANISAEVDVADAVSYLTERKKKLTEMQGQFAARLNQIGSQIYALQSKLQAVQSQLQAEP